jgi:hypothetical protein
MPRSGFDTDSDEEDVKWPRWSQSSVKKLLGRGKQDCGEGAQQQQQQQQPMQQKQEEEDQQQQQQQQEGLISRSGRKVKVMLANAKDKAKVHMK